MPQADLEVLATEPVERRARGTLAALQRPSAVPPPQEAEPIERAPAPAAADRSALESRHAAMLGIFETIALLVSARVLLLLAILGAFTLALLAILKGSMLGLETLGAFGALVVLPVVWLERYARIEGRGE